MADLTNRRPHRVLPHEVEHGDIILGTHQPVERIVFDGTPGRWYYTYQGTILGTSTIDSTVTVWRDTTGRYLDWCNPKGIIRP